VSIEAVALRARPLLSDGDHQVRVLSAKVADYEALDPLDV
jgi:hypothetical protein